MKVRSKLSTSPREASRNCSLSHALAAILTKESERNFGNFLRRINNFIRSMGSSSTNDVNKRLRFLKQKVLDSAPSRSVLLREFIERLIKHYSKKNKTAIETQPVKIRRP